MTDKFIKNFRINVGQDAFRISQPFIQFVLNDRYITCELKEFKSWIDEICNSKGDRNEKAYEAKRKLDTFFAELLHPFMELKND